MVYKKFGMEGSCMLQYNGGLCLKILIWRILNGFVEHNIYYSYD